MQFAGYNPEMRALNTLWKFVEMSRFTSRGVVYLSVLLLTIKTNQWAFNDRMIFSAKKSPR